MNGAAIFFKSFSQIFGYMEQQDFKNQATLVL